jgi:arylsulfatase
MVGNPNILFVFSDQQHWQAAGFMDPSFLTPHLDRLASQGTVFTEAFCTTPQCSPSRSSIMTGRYPSKTGVWGNMGAAGGDPLQMRTIGSLLQGVGYRTAYFGKWHLGKDPVGTAGWDEDFGVTGPETTDDHEVTRRALAFLRDVGDSDRPFALFLSYNNPHDIYHFDREADPVPDGSVGLPPSWYKKDLATVPAVQRQFMAEDQGHVIVDADGPAWERYREIYRAKVSLYDDELGRVLRALEETGLSAETLVIATSDHGDMDGQHRLIYKGPFMYEHMVRIPLIIRPPAKDRPMAPSQVDFPTVNVDLAPTLADFAGVTMSAADGVSLKPFLVGGGQLPQRDFIIGQYYSKQAWVNPIRMIRTEAHKLTRYRVYGEELYDLRRDPEEIVNRAADPAYGDIKAEMSTALKRWMEENDDPFDAQNPTTREGRPLTG